MAAAWGSSGRPPFPLPAFYTWAASLLALAPDLASHGLRIHRYCSATRSLSQQSAETSRCRLHTLSHWNVSQMPQLGTLNCTQLYYENKASCLREATHSNKFLTYDNCGLAWPAQHSGPFPHSSHWQSSLGNRLLSGELFGGHLDLRTSPFHPFTRTSKPTLHRNTVLSPPLSFLVLSSRRGSGKLR
jgi:hypothetical protein